MAKFLGIDYGKKKIGLAVSDGSLAEAGQVLEVSGLADALHQIRQQVSKAGAEVVVVGRPDSGEALNLQQRFIKELKKACPDLEVVEADETLTSKQAASLMVESAVPKKRRTREDAYSAALILQNYLDSHGQ